MTVVTQPRRATRVRVVGVDATVRNAVARLLALDPLLTATGGAPTSARDASRDVRVDDALLQTLKDTSIADFIELVKGMPARHLRALPGGAKKLDMLELLSERELQVVRLVAEGLSNKQIGLHLELSDKTIKNHISHILAKLGLSARTQVAVHALRAGIV